MIKRPRQVSIHAYDPYDGRWLGTMSWDYRPRDCRDGYQLHRAKTFARAMKAAPELEGRRPTIKVELQYSAGRNIALAQKTNRG